MPQEKDSRQYIKIRGANEHNLKNVDVDIPRDKLMVLTLVLADQGNITGI